MINKHSVEDILVPRLGTAVPTPETDLYDRTTDAQNLPLGGLGAFTKSNVAGSYIPRTPVANGSITLNNTPYLQFILRRDTALDRAPVPQYTYLKTGEIKPFQNCAAIDARIQPALTARSQAWLTGAPAGSVGEVQVLDETEYRLQATQRGWRSDLFNGQNQPTRFASFTTPDFFSSNIYTNINQQRDLILQSVAYDFNVEGADAYFDDAAMLCFDSQATVAAPAAANVLTLAQLKALTVGSSFIAGFTDDGQPIRFTVDADLIAMFNAIPNAANGGLDDTAQMVPFARNTAANRAVATRVIAGGRVAGTPQAQVDHLMTIALEVADAYYDDESTKKSRLDLGLVSGFDSQVNSAEVVTPSTGTGYGKEVRLWFQHFIGNRMYSGTLQDWQGMNTPISSEIKDNAIYDLVFVDYCYGRVASSGMPSFSPRSAVIGIQAQRFEGFDGYVSPATVNPQLTYVVDLLNAWVPLANPTFQGL